MFVCYDKYDDLTRSDTKVGADIVIESTGMSFRVPTSGVSWYDKEWGYSSKCREMAGVLSK